MTTPKDEKNQQCPVRIILLELPHGAAADMAESWRVRAAEALLGFAYWLNTGSRAVLGCQITAQDGGGERRDGLSRYGSPHG